MLVLFDNWASLVLDCYVHELLEFFGQWDIFMGDCPSHVLNWYNCRLVQRLSASLGALSKLILMKSFFLFSLKFKFINVLCLFLVLCLLLLFWFFNQHLWLLYVVSQAVKVCLENAPNTQEDCEVFRESSMQYKSFLEEVLYVTGESLTHGIPFCSSSFCCCRVVSSQLFLFFTFHRFLLLVASSFVLIFKLSNIDIR